MSLTGVFLIAAPFLAVFCAGLALFLARRAVRTERAPQAPVTHVECRSWHGVAFHIRDLADETGLALCGYEPLDDRSPVSPSQALDRAAHQHEGWRYCSACLQAFTGVQV